MKALILTIAIFALAGCGQAHHIGGQAVESSQADAPQENHTSAETPHTYEQAAHEPPLPYGSPYARQVLEEFLAQFLSLFRPAGFTPAGRGWKDLETGQFYIDSPAIWPPVATDTPAWLSYGMNKLEPGWLVDWNHPEFTYDFRHDGSSFFDRHGNLIGDVPFIIRRDDDSFDAIAGRFTLMDIDPSGIPIIIVEYWWTGNLTFGYEDGVFWFRYINGQFVNMGQFYFMPPLFFRTDDGRLIAFYDDDLSGPAAYYEVIFTDTGVEMALVMDHNTAWQIEQEAQNPAMIPSWHEHHWRTWLGDLGGWDAWYLNDPVMFFSGTPLTFIPPLTELQEIVTASITSHLLYGTPLYTALARIEPEPWEYAGVYDILHTTFVRINDSMPEFTIYHMLDINAIPSPHFHPFPSPRAITLRIEDEEGNVIQTITGLTQNADFATFRGVTFADYNFDGYLDMRLRRYQHGVGGLLSEDYFWLWDTAARQFVLNGQLTDVEQSELDANEETRQIETWVRLFGGTLHGFYEWQGGELVPLSRSVAFHGMSIDFPANWLVVLDYPEAAGRAAIRLYRIDDENTRLSLFVSYLIAGYPMDTINQNPSQPFIFADGSSGYMMEFDGGIFWLHPGSGLCCGVAFWGERSVFYDNEHVILAVARSLRMID